MKRFLTLTMVLLAVLCASAAGAPEQAGAQEAALPLTRLVLFSSGVGYFQHDGTVDGEARAELTFSVSQINDLLKSLVLRDLDGGSVRSVTYASRDPVARALKSFTIDLTANPSFAGILSQLRGEEISLVAPDRLVGKVIGVEEHVTQRDGSELTTSYSLNLLTADGIRTVPLDTIEGFHISRPELEAELIEALRLMASSKDLAHKKVALEFSGQGRRRVSVGYIVETPVWKTSYRLVLGEGAAHFLQGWAIVENTTDEDWRGVSLSLVSGRPISFTMDLYQPLYVQRPAVQLELYSSLRPQTYEMAMDDQTRSEGAMAEEMDAEPMAKFAAAPPSVSMPSAPRAMAGSGSGRAATPSEVRVDQGVTAAATAGEVGELFQYAIEKPVTLLRQQSALLPIVNQNVGAERYSIYNESVHAKYPLHGLKLKNSSSLNLMQGPITIFDGGVYAGDAQISNLPPGAEVFLSYALDLETEVVPSATVPPEELTSLRVSKGVLVASTRYRREKTYTIRSRGTKGRTVMVEHPLDSAWTLIEPKEATEKTRDSYRFAVPVDAGRTKALTVTEERVADQTFAVTNLANDRIDLFVRSRVASAALKEAFQRVVALRQSYQEALAERQRLEARVQEIGKDQPRIRENMARLERNTPLYNRYVTTLTEQENELGKLAGQIESARALEASRKKELEAFILAMDVR